MTTDNYLPERIKVGWPREAKSGEYLLLLLLLLVGGACLEHPTPVLPEGSIDWSATAAVDKHEVQVGEDFALTLTVTHPVGGSFVPPSAADFEPFEVIGQTEEEVSLVESRIVYRLTAYRLPEDLEVPALSLRYWDDGKELAELETVPIAVQLLTSLTPDVTDIHDIKDPVTLKLPRDPRLLLWFLAAIVGAVAAYLMYRNFRREPEESNVAFEPPLPPADLEAEAALKLLAEKHLPAKGDLVAFYAELSDIMKRYTGRRFQISYLEKTTDEILFQLRAKRIAGSPEAPLRPILETSDLVKFAKSSPAGDEAEASLRDAETFLGRTRRRTDLGATA